MKHANRVNGGVLMDIAYLESEDVMVLEIARIHQMKGFAPVRFVYKFYFFTNLIFCYFI